MKTFRNWRYQMLKDNAIGGYLVYASGEIILVIIGILLGLSLNKWNEERKAIELLESDLQIVAQDLKQDTLDAANRIKMFRDIEAQIDSMINGTADTATLKRCTFCRGFVTSASPFFMETRGYDLLRKYTEDPSFYTDTLLTEVNEFYSLFIKLNDFTTDMMIENATRNLYTWQDKYEWFYKAMDRKTLEDPEFFNYLLTDPNYRNMMAFRKILVYQNYLPMLERFVTQGEALIKKIEERVEH